MRFLLSFHGRGLISFADAEKLPMKEARLLISRLGSELEKIAEQYKRKK